MTMRSMIIVMVAVLVPMLVVQQGPSDVDEAAKGNTNRRYIDEATELVGPVEDGACGVDAQRHAREHRVVYAANGHAPLLLHQYLLLIQHAQLEGVQPRPPEDH